MRCLGSGTAIEFPGYLRAYVEGSDDPEAELADRERFLPKLISGENLKTLGMEALEHNTQPPARFTEGTLIKELERLGIGRPSTWATIVDIVLSRDYAFKKGSALVDISGNGRDWADGAFFTGRGGVFLHRQNGRRFYCDLTR